MYSVYLFENIEKVNSWQYYIQFTSPFLLRRLKGT